MTLTFNNGRIITTVHSSVGTAPHYPRRERGDIRNGFTPTFSGRFPESYNAERDQDHDWDLEHKVSLHAFDIIHVHVLPGTRPATPFLPFFPPVNLEQGHLYSLEITFALTHGEPLGDNTTSPQPVESFLISFLSGRIAPNVFLPIVTPGPQRYMNLEHRR